MNEKLQQLKDGCADVTEGPWEWSGYPIELHNEKGCMVVSKDSNNGRNQDILATVVDADHIARCDPQTITLLFDKIDKLELALKDISQIELGCMEPNGADIPEHLDAYIQCLHVMVDEAVDISELALKESGDG